jgi:hypothetical protein
VALIGALAALERPGLLADEAGLARLVQLQHGLQRVAGPTGLRYGLLKVVDLGQQPLVQLTHRTTP